MQSSEDIVKACKKAEIHPDLASALIKLHTTQRDLEEELRTLRTSMLEMAKVVSMAADVSSASYATMTAVAQKNGIDFNAMFNPEEPT